MNCGIDGGIDVVVNSDGDVYSDIGGDVYTVAADQLNQQGLCGEEGNLMRFRNPCIYLPRQVSTVPT